jgi:uncharacterized protein YfbU (UPF0304 family)
MARFDFTVKERLFLVNQYRILEKLYPDEAEFYAKQRKIVASGYALNWEWLAPEISSTDQSLTIEECIEVCDILEMHRALSDSRASTGINADTVRFWGFDGNTEVKQLDYAHYVLTSGDGWSEIRNERDDYNSHLPLLDSYRAMLREWRPLPDKFNLSKEEIERITSARPK